MNILIIPEDSRKDKYILKPLFKALFTSMKKPHARVRVCEDPILGGVEEAMKPENIQEIVQQYRGQADIFILCIDRDGHTGRCQQLNKLEEKFDQNLIFLASNAWEELETWVLAGLKNLPKEWPSWKIIRAEVHVKENYFDKLAVKRRITRTLGGGRKKLAERAAREIKRIRQLCPEDFDDLAKRLEDRIKNQL